LVLAQVVTDDDGQDKAQQEAEKDDVDYAHPIIQQQKILPRHVCTFLGEEIKILHFLICD
jgi:hypothetical protein